MSRTSERDHFDPAVRVQLLEKDCDEFDSSLGELVKNFDAKLTRVEDGQNTIRTVLTMLLCSVAGGAVLAAINILLGTIHK